MAFSFLLCYNGEMKKALVMCIDCGLVRETFSRAQRCNPCQSIIRFKEARDQLIAKMKSLGHEEINFTAVNDYGKSTYTFTHPSCGTKQNWTSSNLTKQFALHPTIAPCKKCGAKRRTDIATEAWVKRYGRNYDVTAWDDFRAKARQLTEKNFRLHGATINPLGLKRSQGKSGYHLDHIKPLIQCFLDGDQPEFAARIENLQMLSAFDNISKGRK